MTVIPDYETKREAASAWVRATSILQAIAMVGASLALPILASGWPPATSLPLGVVAIVVFSTLGVVSEHLLALPSSRRESELRSAIFRHGRRGAIALALFVTLYVLFRQGVTASASVVAYPKALTQIYQQGSAYAAQHGGTWPTKLTDIPLGSVRQLGGDRYNVDLAQFDVDARPLTLVYRGQFALHESDPLMYAEDYVDEAGVVVLLRDGTIAWYDRSELAKLLSAKQGNRAPQGATVKP